jgi:hypothetical protein
MLLGVVLSVGVDIKSSVGFDFGVPSAYPPTSILIIKQPRAMAKV